MKKTTMILSLLLAALLLASCGAADVTEAATDGFDGVEYEAEEAYDEYAYNEYDAAYPEEAPAAAEPGDGFAAGVSPADMSDKIIYTGYGEIETTEFEETVEQVYALMDRYGAFLESSSVTGTNLDTSSGRRDTRTSRSASFCLRVPRENYSAMTSSLDTLGNVTYFSSTADNVTARYTDTQSRLSAYEVEEQRLLELLGQAEDVEDMLYIEDRLSQIRYEKESLTSQLRLWDGQVSYSTVNLTVREVQVYTPEPTPEPEGYWAQVGSGFTGTLRAMGEGFKTAFRLFVAALPVLLLLLVLGGVALLIVLLATRRSRRARRAAKRGASEPDKL